MAEILDTKISTNFSNYLGFPMFRKNPKATDFQFLIDKMRNKLASWKTIFLSLAARTTLATVSLSSIPSYYMQYTSLPTKVIKHIDKIQRDFI